MNDQQNERTQIEQHLQQDVALRVLQIEMCLGRVQLLDQVVGGVSGDRGVELILRCPSSGRELRCPGSWRPAPVRPRPCRTDPSSRFPCFAHAAALRHHSSIRSMPKAMMQAQNMIDLTVEFTRIPLFRCWRSRQTCLQHRLYLPLDAGTFLKSQKYTECLAADTPTLPPGRAVTSIVLSRPGRLVAIMGPVLGGIRRVNRPEVPLRKARRRLQAGSRMRIPGSGSTSTPCIQTMRPSSSRTGQRARLEPVTLRRSSTSFTLRGAEE